MFNARQFGPRESAPAQCVSSESNVECAVERTNASLSSGLGARVGSDQLASTVKAFSSKSSEASSVECTIDQNVTARTAEPPDAKLVHGSETKMYWAGRYTSTCDRIRSCPDDGCVGIASSPERADRAYDRKMRSVRISALKQLQCLCATSAALDSCISFVMFMHKNDADIGQLELSQILEPKSRVAQLTSRRYVSVGYARSSTQRSTLRRSAARLATSCLPRSLTTGDIREASKSLTSPQTIIQQLQPSSTRLPTRQYKLEPDHNVQSVHWKDYHRDVTPIAFEEPSINIGELRQSRATASDQLDGYLFPHCHGSASTELLLSGGTSPTPCTSVALGNLERPIDKHGKFRKSDSMKRLVDVSIREIMRLGRRADNSSGNHPE